MITIQKIEGRQRKKVGFLKQLPPDKEQLKQDLLSQHGYGRYIFTTGNGDKPGYKKIDELLIDYFHQKYDLKEEPVNLRQSENKRGFNMELGKELLDLFTMKLEIITEKIESQYKSLNNKIDLISDSIERLDENIEEKEKDTKGDLEKQLLPLLGQLKDNPDLSKLVEQITK